MLGICLVLVIWGINAQWTPIQYSRPISKLRHWWQMRKIEKMLAELKKPHTVYSTVVDLPTRKPVRILPTSSAWIELVKVRTDLREAEFAIRVMKETERHFSGVTSLSSNIDFCPLIGSKALRLTGLTLTNATIRVYQVQRD